MAQESIQLFFLLAAIFFKLHFAAFYRPPPPPSDTRGFLFTRKIIACIRINVLTHVRDKRNHWNDNNKRHGGLDRSQLQIVCELPRVSFRGRWIADDCGLSIIYYAYYNCLPSINRVSSTGRAVVVNYHPWKLKCNNDKDTREHAESGMHAKIKTWH